MCWCFCRSLLLVLLPCFMGLCQREGAVTLLVKVKPVETLGGNAEEFSHSCSAFVFHQDVDRSVEMLGFCAEERAAWGLSLLSHGDTLLGVCHSAQAPQGACSWNFLLKLSTPVHSWLQTRPCYFPWLRCGNESYHGN